VLFCREPLTRAIDELMWRRFKTHPEREIGTDTDWTLILITAGMAPCIYLPILVVLATVFVLSRNNPVRQIRWWRILGICLGILTILYITYWILVA
jgi:hypothetical protein